MYTIFIGSDHAGYSLKSFLIQELTSKYDVIDCGPERLDKQDDYPDYAQKVCEQVLEHSARGILICDTGIGMSIAANRYEGIRAALVTTEFMAERSRLHNNSNVLCLGEALLSNEENLALVHTWLQTDFIEEERHIRRVEKLDMLG
ncbi:MAG TPA: ribose 5-phosphate isomerase B [Patescibacteria group bacterium]